MKEANAFLIIFIVIVIGKGIQQTFFPDSDLIHLFVMVMIVGVAGFLGKIVRSKLYHK